MSELKGNFQIIAEQRAEIETLRSQLVKKNECLTSITDDLRDNYPAVDVTTVIFSADFAGVGCCVIPQERVLELIAALTDEKSP